MLAREGKVTVHIRGHGMYTADARGVQKVLDVYKEKDRLAELVASMFRDDASPPYIVFSEKGYWSLYTNVELATIVASEYEYSPCSVCGSIKPRGARHYPADDPENGPAHIKR